MPTSTNLSAKRPYRSVAPQPNKLFVSAELQRVGAGFLVTMNDRRGRKWTPPRKDRTHPTADLAVDYVRANHPEVTSVFVTLA